jgi:hypothetical protein
MLTTSVVARLLPFHLSRLVDCVLSSQSSVLPCAIPPLQHRVAELEAHVGVPATVQPGTKLITFSGGGC